jgi:hypothetical protein
MAEWLILSLLVPAVVVPAVLLFGFAGCDNVFGLTTVQTVPTPPMIVSAEGLSASIIRLTWSYSGSPPATEFEFERTRVLDAQDIHTFNVPASPFDDNNDGQGLNELESYSYRVRSIGSDGEAGAWSAPVIGTTLSFQTTFAWTVDEEARASDVGGSLGLCLVQRIEAIRLSKSGIKIRVTLRAAAGVNAAIDRLYISRPDPAPGKDPYDSDTDLTTVASAAVIVPANNSVTLPAVPYNLDAGQPLLIAIDFSTTLYTDMKVVGNVSSAEATTYFKLMSSDASSRDRSGFLSIDRITLIEKIEVG